MESEFLVPQQKQKWFSEEMKIIKEYNSTQQ